MQIIYGLHSIRACINNPKRVFKVLIGSKEGVKELFKGKYSYLREHRPLNIEIISSHQVQEKAKNWCKKLQFEYGRVPSQVFAICEPLEPQKISHLYEKIQKKEKIRILALDGVSDIHNGAAIMRTASFYGVDALVLTGRKSFGFSPGFFRIASGAVESLQVIQVMNLSKTLSKFKELGVRCIGLSEHGEKILSSDILGDKNCLVMGTEDTGLSHAVERQLDERVKLESQGAIKSLNVSVATAISLERCFSKD